LKTELTCGLTEHSFVYYNHGYYAPMSKYTVATTNYIQEYSAILKKDNFYACQFHSEISGMAGQRIFENFLNI
jgi:imidazole glycerol-phosphate synthase subunit HisH